MSEIQTFQDSDKGVYSQIKLTDGKKILVSITQAEIAVFKVGFGSIPTGTIYKKDMASFLEGLSLIAPEEPMPLLNFIVSCLLGCDDISQVKDFLNSVSGGPDE